MSNESSSYLREYIKDLQDKLEKAKAFIKAECYCEMDGDIPKHCKNCQFLEGIENEH